MDGPLEFGPYRLLKEVGRGGMAEVFLAEITGSIDESTNAPQRVAIKRILPHYAVEDSFVRMFHDEAHIAASIDHDNICRVFDLGEANGLHYIAMEFVDGVDLAAILRTLRKKRRAMPVAETLFVARMIAMGLHAAHNRVGEAGQIEPIIHRDVSPHNILVGYDGEVKLTDFGVAKAKNNQALTRSGVIKGKLQYMSPEQAQARSVDARSDVFSLGLTIYKMLTGRLPFRGQNEFQIYEQILHKKPAPPSTLVQGIPPRVDAIVMRALRKDPARRFASAEEMAHLLQRALGEVQPGFTPRDLARFLAREVPRKLIVQKADPDQDDDLHPSGGASAAPLRPPTPDADEGDSSIDQLTALAAPPIFEEPDLHNQATAMSPRPRPDVVPVEDLAPDSRPASVPSMTTNALHLRPPRRRMGLLVALLLLIVAAAGTTLWAFNSGEEEVKQVVINPPPPPEPKTARIGVPGPEVAPTPPKPPTQAPVASAGTDDPAEAAAADVAEVDKTPTEPALAADGAVARADEAPEAAKADPTPRRRRARRRSPDRKTVERKTVERKGGERSARVAQAAAEDGFLNINTIPWSWVELDGRALKKHTPLMRYKVASGRHKVKLTTSDGRVVERTVTVKPGKAAVVTFSFPE